MKNKSKKNYFKFLKKRNVKLFSVFLAAAFFFLILTKLSQSYTQDIQLKVTLDNLEDDIVVLNDSFVTAKAVLNSKGFGLLPYLFSASKNISVDAKKETFKRGQRMLWDIGNNKYQLKKVFGNSVEIISIKPDTIAFEYDVLASKIVAVNLVKDISFVEGFDVVDKLELTQDSVKIIGSKKQLDTIQVLETEPLVLSEVNTDIDQQITLENKFKNLKIIPKNLGVKGEVRQFTEGKFSIPVKITNQLPDKNINFFPKKVELIYYTDIKNFSSINLKDFKVVADFSELKDDEQNTLQLKITKFPKSVKNVRLLQNSIEFIISD